MPCAYLICMFALTIVDGLHVLCQLLYFPQTSSTCAICVGEIAATRCAGICQPRSCYQNSASDPSDAQMKSDCSFFLLPCFCKHVEDICQSRCIQDCCLDCYKEKLGACSLPSFFTDLACSSKCRCHSRASYCESLGR